MGHRPNPTTISLSIPEGGTGQISEMETIGLYFYNARFYDPSLGRFVSADTLIPQPAPCAALQGCCAINPMAWDRYAYALNNPLRYTDPSGHVTCTSEGVCIGDKEKTVSGNNHHSWLLGMINNGFGVTMKGNWTNNLSLIYKALYSVGRAFARTIGDGVSPYRAFKQAYGINNNNPFTIEMDSSNSQLYRDEGGNAKGGVTLSSNYIVFQKYFMVLTILYTNLDTHLVIFSVRRQLYPTILRMIKIIKTQKVIHISPEYILIQMYFIQGDSIAGQNPMVLVQNGNKIHLWMPMRFSPINF